MDDTSSNPPSAVALVFSPCEPGMPGTCPICGGLDPCRVARRTGTPGTSGVVAVFCTEPDVVNGLKKPEDVAYWERKSGWKLLRGRCMAFATVKDKGVPGVFAGRVADDGALQATADDLPPPTVDPKQAAIEAYKEQGKQIARDRWEECEKLDKSGNKGQDHPRIRAYLEARGIPVDRLIGGQLPPSLRFHPRCFDSKVDDADERRGWRREYSPAMVGRIVEFVTKQGRPVIAQTAVHLTFLHPDPEKPGKRPERPGWGAVKKMHGAAKGRVIMLHPPRQFPGGVLGISEGIETSASCIAATGFAWWSALSAEGMRAMIVPPELVTPPSSGAAPIVHTLIFGGDLNKSVLKAPQVEKYAQGLVAEAPGLAIEDAMAIARLPTGQRAAAAAAAIHRALYPWISVYTRWPTWAAAPGLVCLDPELLERTPLCGDKPAGKASGVDWNDVLNMPGTLEERLDRVRLGLLAGINLEANREMAALWNDVAAIEAHKARLRAERAVPAGPARRGEVGSGGASGGHSGRGPAPRAPAAADSSGTGGSGPPEGVSTQASSEDQPPIDPAWADNIENAKAMYRWSEEGYDRHCISPEPADRARLFLLDQCVIPGCRRFSLLYWGGKFWSYERGEWREIERDVQLFGWVQDWLLGFLHKRELKTSDDIQPVQARKHDVEEIIASLAGNVRASFTAAPCWLAPNLTEDGHPLWGRALFARDDELAYERGDPAQWTVYRNGRLDMTALKRREVRLLANTPDLFTFAVRPYDLRIDWLEEALRTGWTEDLYARVCPNFRKFLLGQTTDQEGNPLHDREEMIRSAQRILGDSLGADRSIHKIIMWIGLPGTGKDTWQDVIAAACGEPSVGISSFFHLADKYGIKPLVGKSVCLLPDAHVGELKEGSIAVEHMKCIRGQSRVAVRDMYRVADTQIKIPLRFHIFCNDEPDKLLDNSGAFSSSLVIYKMTRIFRDTASEDRGLRARLPRERQGICVWGLTGYADLWTMERPTLGMTERSRRVQESMERASAPMKAFVKACCVPGVEEEQPFQVVYAVYKRWCEQNDRRPVGRNTFTSRLAGVVGEVEVDEKVRPVILRGVRLKDGLPPELLMDGTPDSYAGAAEDQRDIPF